MPQNINIGVSFKRTHLQDIMMEDQPIDFFEVHAENYFTPSPIAHQALEQICTQYALSIHGVGLSLAGTAPLDEDHIDQLRTLYQRYQPCLLSEHLAWSVDDGHYYNDLWPVPYNQASLDHLCQRIHHAQDKIGCALLIENPARYVDFAENDMEEGIFFTQLCHNTGCGMLLDITNLTISGYNLNFDPRHALASYPIERIGEIHFAGCEYRSHSQIMIDSHAAPISKSAMSLYHDLKAMWKTMWQDRQKNTISHPYLLMEWDNHVPAWDVFRQEAQRLRAL